MRGWFMFKGIDSRDYGILMASAPSQTKPPRRSKEITIPGRSGFLLQDEEVYDAYTISFECSTRGTDYLEDITAWLNGSGELILFTEPERVYQATIQNKIDISDVIYLYNKFLLQFRVQPFKYRDAPQDDTRVLTESKKLVNKGNVFSLPLITVYGAGNITLLINEKEFPLYGVSESITIDSELMEVYKGDTNQNSKYGGTDFPRLETGVNIIDWTGTVEKVEVVPRWRYL